MQKIIVTTPAQLRVLIRELIKEEKSRQLQSQNPAKAHPKDSSPKQALQLTGISRENLCHLLEESAKIINLIKSIITSICAIEGMHQHGSEQSNNALLIVYFVYCIITNFCSCFQRHKQKKCPASAGHPN